MYEHVFGNILLWTLSCILAIKRGVWRLGRKLRSPISDYADLVETENRLASYRSGLSDLGSLFQFVKLETKGEPLMIVDVLIEQRLNLIRAIISEMRYKWKDIPLPIDIPDGAVTLFTSWRRTTPAGRIVEVDGRVRWAALRTNFSWSDAADMLYIAGVVTMTDLRNFKELRDRLGVSRLTPALLEEQRLISAWSLMNKERTQHGHSVPHP